MSATQAERRQLELEQIAECRRVVRARARDRCEAWTPDCPRGPHYGTQMHHVWPEDRRAKRHAPDRCLWLCNDAHDWTHAHPLAAQTLGTMRPPSGRLPL